MAQYNLKFKRKPDEFGYWNTSIYAENDEEAIEKAKTYAQYGYYKPILEKPIYKTKKIWEEGDK